MISAYQTALTGLKAFSTTLQSNGNNIANANTNGFKKPWSKIPMLLLRA